MLHLAGIFDHKEIAMLLIDCGSVLEVENLEKETPLQVATPSLRQKMRDRVAARDAGAGAGDP